MNWGGNMNNTWWKQDEIHRLCGPCLCTPTHLLLDDIQNIVDAPKAIAGLEEDHRSIEVSLEALKAMDSSDWQSLGQEVASESKFAIDTSTKACDRFDE